MKKILKLALAFALVTTPALAGDIKILFIGNSFTYGAASGTIHYNSQTVTDLNRENIGGVPALFESFTEQAGLKYKVFLETRPGANLDWHYNNRLRQISRPWDVVVMHGYSTLDAANPNDPTKLTDYAGRLSQALVARNRDVKIYLTATWARADLVYRGNGNWFGTPIAKMAQDIRAGYNLAAQTNPPIVAVIPVGEAWNMAFERGIADPNPYDGIEYGKVDLWGWDHYHASNYGYYLHALVVFAQVTGKDPRTLGAREKSANDLGISPSQASALQGIAFSIVDDQN
jgi:hypothetical protein